ncbi:hypothetical protein HK100_005083 [Physocladia obscura]|uniref:SH3 domain-containing protein n=1 Tax=Physocladia obscura TaxID=109957 RepID=A0AAD5SS48_9FUNG|nr:hypothetical protein HK100_005083 [Physocladia obscura]
MSANLTKLRNAVLGETPPIQARIADEKEVVRATRTLAKAHGQASRSLTSWGRPEAEDIKCISAHLASLSDKVDMLHVWLADEFEISRSILKDIQLREELLASLKKKQRDLQAKLDSAVKKAASTNSSTSRILGTSAVANNTPAAQADLIRIELGGIDREVMVAVADFEGFKREAFRKAEKRKWNALIEYCAKLVVIANFGNHVSDQIPQGKLAPGYDLPAFKNAHIVSQIMVDYEAQSAEWRNFIPADINFSPSSLQSSTTKLQPASSPLKSPTITNESILRRASTDFATSIVQDEIYTASPVVSHNVQPYIAEAFPTISTQLPSTHNRQSSLVAPNAFQTASPLSPASMPQRNSLQFEYSPTPISTDPVDEEIYVDAIPIVDADVIVAAEPISATVQSSSPTNTLSSLPQQKKQQQQPRVSTRPPSTLVLALHEAGSDAAKGLGSAGSVGDGVTEMIRGVAINTSSVPPTTTTTEAAIVATATQRRVSSLVLALAESGGDEKKGIVGVGLRGSSVGDGVTDMLKGIVPGVVATADVTIDGGGGEVVQVPLDNVAEVIDLNSDSVATTDSKKVLGTFVVMFNYEKTAGKVDEISISVGDLVVASNVYEDGWGYGKILNTNSAGFFPFNAVYPVLNASGRAYRSNSSADPETTPPLSISGVAVSPPPLILHQEGAIGKDDYDCIFAAMKRVGFV